MKRTLKLCVIHLYNWRYLSNCDILCYCPDLVELVTTDTTAGPERGPGQLTGEACLSPAVDIWPSWIVVQQGALDPHPTQTAALPEQVLLDSMDPPEPKLLRTSGVLGRLGACTFLAWGCLGTLPLASLVSSRHCRGSMD